MMTLRKVVQEFSSSSKSKINCKGNENSMEKKYRREGYSFYKVEVKRKEGASREVWIGSGQSRV